jgi:hypothetical protein
LITRLGAEPVGACTPWLTSRNIPDDGIVFVILRVDRVFGRVAPGYPDPRPNTSMPELHMAKSDNSAKMPSHVDDRLSLFDRIASYTSERGPRAWFFGFAPYWC